MLEMFEQNIKKKNIQKMKKTTKNVDIMISNDEEEFDTNEKNDWIDNDLKKDEAVKKSKNVDNNLKKREVLKKSKNIEFTNKVNE